MHLDFLNLGSGSRGNCTLIECGNTCILVDAGLSCRQITSRLISAGKDPARVQGICITHGHSDHISGVGKFCADYNIPVYCNSITQSFIALGVKKANQKMPEFRNFNTRDCFQIGDVRIETFEVSHDIGDPIGYVFQTGAIKIGVVTDLGRMTTLVQERIRGAYALLFESNHDLGLLRNSSRPWRLIQRICANTGHLSNEQSAEALNEISSDGLKVVSLAHLSEECNHPDLALNAVLDKLQGKDIEVKVAFQEGPTWILPKDFDV